MLCDLWAVQIPFGIKVKNMIIKVCYSISLSSHFALFVLILGVINIPAVALGMFSGGLLMKRLKLNIMGAAKFACSTSLIGYMLSLFFFAMSCENAKVAGVTLSYNR